MTRLARRTLLTLAALASFPVAGWLCGEASFWFYNHFINPDILLYGYGAGADGLVFMFLWIMTTVMSWIVLGRLWFKIFKREVRA